MILNHYYTYHKNVWLLYKFKSQLVLLVVRQCGQRSSDSKHFFINFAQTMMMSLWGPGEECGSKNRFSAHLTEHIGGSRPEKCHRSHIATSIHFPRRIHNTTKSCGGSILRTALYGERMAMMAVVGHFLMCGLIR